MKAGFINERGREIVIEVEEKEIEGVPGVVIRITGPDSMSENHITRKEAEELHTMLAQVFEKDS